MGVAPYKTFTFDGESSADYGVYLTGEGVFNAPQRAVEMVSIPGRNGAIAIDQGRFENISVTYRAGMYDVDENNFADKVSALRNWLCSKTGYCRLEDEYNPGEYRMALYTSGIEVEHDMLIAGEFEIEFECKPQRWLASGETAVAVTSGGTLTNPTLFDASPLLEVAGATNSTIIIGDSTLALRDVVFGNINYPGGSITTGAYWATGLDDGRLNVGDTVVASNVRYDYQIEFPIGYTLTSHTLSIVSSAFTSSLSVSLSGRILKATVLAPSVTAAYTTSLLTQAANIQGSIYFTDENGTAGSTVAQGDATYQLYSGKTARLDIGISTQMNSTVTRTQSVSCSGVSAYSTVQALGGTVYIDCESGQAYRLFGDTPVGVNMAVSFPAELPVVKPGANTITYSVTSLKVTPRWWKI